MKQKMVEIEIRQPESRLERERREKLRRAELVYGVLAWVMLLAGLGLAVTGLVHNFGNQNRRNVQELEEVPPVAAQKLVATAVVARKERSVEEKWDMPLSWTEWEALLGACEENSIDPSLALGLIEVESSFRAGAVNPLHGCYGYCQLNPDYFPSGLSPEENIEVGIGYLGNQLRRYDNLEAALTAYNAGHDTGDRVYAEKVLSAAERWASVLCR